MSTRDTATAIGASHTTVERDLAGTNVPEDINLPAEIEEADSLLDVEIIGGNHGVQRRGPLCARVALILVDLQSATIRSNRIWLEEIYHWIPIYLRKQADTC